MEDGPLTGSVFGNYRVGPVLGRGGMSIVYLAENVRLERSVALKFLAPELAGDPAFRERFIAESRLAAGLEHPNVIPIYEADELDGRLYIAMRYVRGPTLADVIRTDAPLDPGRVVSILHQMAGALDAAHAQGLVHRDVKPPNILLASPTTSGEHAYLSDFGITKRTGTVSGLTHTGQFMGTVDYVAPEQIEGRTVDGRADEYSLGCVAFECLSGAKPFPRPAEVAVLMAHLKERPPSVRTARPELPQAVDEVLQRAMAKSPEDRYPTCGEFVRALGQALEPAEARTASRRPISVVGAAALVVGAVVAGLVLFGGKHTPPVDVPTPTTQTTPAASPAFTGIVRIDPITRKVTARIAAQLGTGAHGEFTSARTTAAGSGGVWVLHPTTGTVGKINPTSNTFVGQISLPVHVRFGGGVVTSDGRVWVVSAIPDKPGAEFIKIDPNTNRASSPVEMAGQAQQATTVTAGDGKVWALAAQSLYRIDPKTQAVKAAEIPGTLADVAAADGAVWVLDSLHSTLIEIDPTTFAIRDHVPLPGSPRQVVAGGGAVWVVNSDGTVSRITVGANAGIDTIQVGPDPIAAAVGPDAVWVANRGDGTVTRIDLSDFSTISIKVGGTVDHITAGEGAVWVSVPTAG